MSTHISTLQMDREGWLQARTSGIGGSDAGAVLGLSPYKSPLDVYMEKTGDRVDTPDTARMRAGREMEAVVAAWWTEETGLPVRRDNKIRVHREHPFMLGSVDRCIVGGDLGPGILEVKCTSAWTLKAVEDDDCQLPMSWWAQIQHYLAITGYEWGEFAVMVDGYEFRRYPVKRDDDFIAAMTEIEVRFWNDHVVPRVPPPPSCEADLRKLFPRSVGRAVEADSQTAADAFELRTLKDCIAEMEKRESELGERIRLLMADADTLTSDGRVLVTWKSPKDGVRFDRDRFEQENPELYQKYCSVVPGTRRFLVKK